MQSVRPAERFAGERAIQRRIHHRRKQHFADPRYLNINGTIQSGIPDRILDASESGTAMDVIRQRIETIQAEWEAAGRPTIADVRGIREYRISDGIGENVSVYFNPQTQQIIVDDIEVKGGYVELYGHIMSTGSGQIKALDGYGRIDLRFARFGYDVVVHTLDTGGVQGVIRITDLGKTNDTWGGPVTTVYERVGGHVRTQEWVGDKLISESVATEAGREAVYRPVANQAFVWKRGQDFTTTYIGKKESSSWFDIIPGGMMEYDTFIKTPASGVVDLPNGEYVTEAVLPWDSYFERRQYVSDGMKLVNRSAWSDYSGVDLGGWCFGVRYYYLEDTWKEGSQNIYTHMVRADYPIGIEFIGHDAAPGNRGIWVQSSDRLILNGNVRHTGGETHVSGDDGIIQASDDVLSDRRIGASQQL